MADVPEPAEGKRERRSATSKAVNYNESALQQERRPTYTDYVREGRQLPTTSCARA